MSYPHTNTVETVSFGLIWVVNTNETYPDDSWHRDAKMSDFCDSLELFISQFLRERHNP